MWGGSFITVKQPDFPSTGELVNRLQLIHAVGYVSVDLQKFHIHNKDKCQQCNSEPKMFTIHLCLYRTGNHIGCCIRIYTHCVCVCVYIYISQSLKYVQ